MGWGEVRNVRLGPPSVAFSWKLTFWVHKMIKPSYLKCAMRFGKNKPLLNWTYNVLGTLAFGSIKSFSPPRQIGLKEKRVLNIIFIHETGNEIPLFLEDCSTHELSFCSISGKFSNSFFHPPTSPFLMKLPSVLKNTYLNEMLNYQWQILHPELSCLIWTCKLGGVYITPKVA